MDWGRPLLSRIRWAAFGIVLGFAAMWAGGINPIEWLSAEKESPPTPPSRHVHQPPQPAPSAIPIPPEKPAEALLGTDTSMSKKSLDLILSGTVIGRNANEGLAFIGVNEKNPQTYTAGATLINGARVVQIAKNYVVLERDGTSVRLYAQNVLSRAANTAAQQELLKVGGSRKFKPHVPTSYEPFTDFIRPSPVYEGEALRGYEVYPGKRSGIFSQLGLQPGDVITSLNDAPLTDPQQTMEAFRQLTDGIAAVATIKRKGKPLRVTLDGSIIAADMARDKEQQSSTVASTVSPVS